MKKGVWWVLRPFVYVLRSSAGIGSAVVALEQTIAHSKQACEQIGFIRRGLPQQ